MTLRRFIDAQDRIWPSPVKELRAGRKQTHWMWFVFPQLRGLGRSEMAQFYGIADLAEAQAYLADPVLGTRIEEAFRAMLMNDDAQDVLGHVDALKLRSSATLFGRAGSAAADDIISRFYGSEDPETVRRIVISDCSTTASIDT